MRKALNPVLLALLLSGLMSCCTARKDSDHARRDRIEHLYRLYRFSFLATPEVTVEDLPSGRGATNVVLVDVRTPAEQEVSMIPGAITVEEFETTRSQYSNTRVVAYCTIGARSGQYAEALRKQGFDAANLRGSILAWAHAGRPVVTSTGETMRVHVYGPDWDLLPDGYEAAW